MTENAPEASAAPETPAEQPQGGSEAKTFDADYVEKLRKENAAHRTEKNALAKELEAIRKSTMSETEKAVAEAEARGRTTATQEFGKRLAQSEIRAAAADSAADLAGVFDYLDLARFVGEDGEPDSKAIKAFVEALPKKSQLAPSMDLGQRGAPAATQDFNQTLRRAAGRA